MNLLLPLFSTSHHLAQKIKKSFVEFSAASDSVKEKASSSIFPDARFGEFTCLLAYWFGNISIFQPEGYHATQGSRLLLTHKMINSSKFKRAKVIAEKKKEEKEDIWRSPFRFFKRVFPFFFSTTTTNGGIFLPPSFI